MSQDIFSSIDPAVTSGTELAVILNDFKNAIVSGMSGISRPTETLQGGMWVDTATTDKLILKVFTGTTDVSLFTIDIPGGVLNIDASKIGTGTVTNSEFAYLAGVTSAIQSQIDSKVTGDSTSNINAIATFYNTTGKRVQNGVALLTPMGAMSGLTSFSLNGPLITSNITMDVDTTDMSAIIPYTTSNKIRLHNNSLVSVGGIDSPISGRRIVIQNYTGNTIIINNDDTSTLASKRIITGTSANLNLENEASVELMYDGSLSLWCVVGGSGGGGVSSAVLVDPSVDSFLILSSTDSGKKYIINSANGAFSLYLPQPSSRLSFTIKDSGGQANINEITIMRYSSEKIEGISSNFTANAPYGEWTISCDGTNWHFTS